MFILSKEQKQVLICLHKNIRQGYSNKGLLYKNYLMYIPRYNHIQFYLPISTKNDHVTIKVKLNINHTQTMDEFHVMKWEHILNQDVVGYELNGGIQKLYYNGKTISNEIYNQPQFMTQMEDYLNIFYGIKNIGDYKNLSINKQQIQESSNNRGKFTPVYIVLDDNTQFILNNGVICQKEYSKINNTNIKGIAPIELISYMYNFGDDLQYACKDGVMSIRSQTKHYIVESYINNSQNEIPLYWLKSIQCIEKQLNIKLNIEDTSVNSIFYTIMDKYLSDLELMENGWYITCDREDLNTVKVSILDKDLQSLYSQKMKITSNVEIGVGFILAIENVISMLYVPNIEKEGNISNEKLNRIPLSIEYNCNNAYSAKNKHRYTIDPIVITCNNGYRYFIPTVKLEKK